MKKGRRKLIKRVCEVCERIKIKGKAGTWKTEKEKSQSSVLGKGDKKRKTVT
jgi:hypothetical protein